MLPTLRLHLLGRFQLAYGDTLLTTVKTPRLQSLLAYLVLHRDAAQPRRQVAFSLWPDLPEARARANLRKLFLLLRQALPEAGRFVCAEANALQWRPDAPLALDVAEFEAQAAAPAGWSRAVEVYGGDLLPDCYDEWIVPQRERLRQLYLEVLEHLVQQEEAAGEYDAALGYGQRLLQGDPLREEVHRRLMSLYLLKGDRAAALRTYHACVVTLRRELDVEPGPATRELYERLLRGTAAEPPHVVTPAPGAAALPLVGRAAEWAQLLAAWRAASAGRPQLALLSGEAGIGKTRLAEELVAHLSRQGIATAVAHCYAAEGALPYAPVVEWLRARPLPLLDRVWLAEVARLLPELAMHHPGLPAPGPLTEAWQRQRLHEALARALLGSGSALALQVEDLQWCGRDTLEWLRYLLRFDPRARLLVLGTYRPEEVPADHPLTGLRAALRRSGQLAEVPLGPLDLAETTQLATYVAGQELDATAAAGLYGETEGNPLFVVEMVQAGLLDRTRRAPGVLPPPVQAVIAARLARLSPAAVELAGVAATIGREFSLDVLKQASAADEEALVRGLDELWQQRIVREHGEAAYDFSHGLIREAAYAGLSAARKCLLHRRVAEALAKVYADDLDRISAAAAAHYEQAGLPQRAIPFYRRAAQVAQHVYANDRTVAFLSRALELTPPSALAERYDVLLARERAYDIQGMREPQLRDIADLQSLAQDLRDGRRQAEASLCQARYAESTSDYGAAIAAAQAAIHLSQAAQDVSGEAAGHLQWAAALWQQGQLESARAQGERALELAQAAQRTDLEMAILYNLACITLLQGDYTGALDRAGQAVSFGRQVGDRHIELLVLNLLGIASHHVGDWAAAQTYYEQALCLCQETGDRRQENVVLRNLGGLAQGEGFFDVAQARYEQSLQLSRGIGDRRGESETLAYLGLLFHQLGDERAACAYCQQAARIAEQVGAKVEQGYALTHLGRALAGLGQLPEAADAYQRALAIRRAVGDLSLVVDTLAWLAQALLAQGDLAQARACVEEVLGYLAHHTAGDVEGPMPIYWGCYCVLRAAGDARAVDVLGTAHDWLQEQLARIEDETARGRFLESSIESRGVLAAWEREGQRPA